MYAGCTGSLFTLNARLKDYAGMENGSTVIMQGHKRTIEIWTNEGFNTMFNGLRTDTNFLDLMDAGKKRSRLRKSRRQVYKMEFVHKSVLFAETVAAMQATPGKWLVDGTAGGRRSRTRYCRKRLPLAGSGSGPGRHCGVAPTAGRSA